MGSWRLQGDWVPRYKKTNTIVGVLVVTFDRLDRAK